MDCCPRVSSGFIPDLIEGERVAARTVPFSHFSISENFNYPNLFPFSLPCLPQRTRRGRERAPYSSPRTACKDVKAGAGNGEVSQGI
jgi:hypothetical protein